jgi:hypothetical protein
MKVQLSLLPPCGGELAEERDERRADDLPFERA